MKLVYQDLLRHLDKKPSKEEISERLFQLGHEHEINGDVFDMELTPNRGDCLSLIGLARDLNIFLVILMIFKFMKIELKILTLILRIYQKMIAQKFLF